MLTFSPDLLEDGMRSLLLQKSIAAEPAIIPVLCAVMDSDKATESFPFLGDVPQMQQWDGNRKITRLSHAKYSVTADSFEASLAFSRDDIDDDRLGALRDTFTQLATRAGNHPVVLLVDAIVNGTTNTCYDGAAFFSNAHPARGEQTAAQDNLLAGAGTSVANIQTDLSTQIKPFFRRVKDEANEPWSMDVSNLMVCAPPEMEQNFIEVLFANTVQAGGQNMYQGYADLWVSSRLTDTNDYYVFNLGAGVMPFVFINRQGIQVSISGLDPSVWQNTKEVRVGVDYRAAVGYLYWQCAVKVVN